MRQHLERYTPEICSHLRHMAETRQWKDWHVVDSAHEELLEDLELTYHLHVAAEATGVRKGMPPMPPFPARVIDSEGLLDPAEFIRGYQARHSHRAWNQSDNGAKPVKAANLRAERRERRRSRAGRLKHFVSMLFV